MDDYLKKVLEEENKELNKLKEERLLKIEKDEKLKKSKKNMAELRKEEKKLNDQLDKLRRENFELQVSINSYQVALTRKLAEFKEAESELNTLYKEIWQEREKFCTQTDEFDSRRGLLSDWWKKQITFVADLENLGKTQDESERCNQQIQLLEDEIRDRRETIDDLLEKKMRMEPGESLSESGEPSSSRKETPEPETTDSPTSAEPETKTKKVRFSSDEYCEGGDALQETDADHSSGDPFSIMNLNKMKLLKSKINRLAKNKFSA